LILYIVGILQAKEEREQHFSYSGILMFVREVRGRNWKGREIDMGKSHVL